MVFYIVVQVSFGAHDTYHRNEVVESGVVLVRQDGLSFKTFVFGLIHGVVFFNEWVCD
jgi:hypothetical protein